MEYIKPYIRTEENLIKMSEIKTGQIPWNKGILHSEESLKKMSEKKKGIKNPMYGRKHSEETKEKMRKSYYNRKLKSDKY